MSGVELQIWCNRLMTYMLVLIRVYDPLCYGNYVRKICQAIIIIIIKKHTEGRNVWLSCLKFIAALIYSVDWYESIVVFVFVIKPHESGGPHSGLRHISLRKVVSVQLFDVNLNARLCWPLLFCVI